MLTVREQAIDKRLNDLESRDVTNLVSGKISEEELETAIFGRKALKDEKDMDVIAKRVEDNVFDYLQTLKLLEAANERAEKAKIAGNLKAADRDQYRPVPARNMRSNADGSKEGEVDGLEETAELNLPFPELVTMDEWRSHFIIKEVITKIDKKISQR